MQTGHFTIQVRDISLDDGETFRVKPPGFFRRSWLIHWIRVTDGHFELLGDPRGGRGSLVFPRTFGSVREVPSMPAAVAEEVQHCLAANLAAGRRFSSVE